MLTAELKVNGSLIGYLRLVRVKSGPTEKEASEYSVEYYEPGKTPVKLNVMHIPVFGALRLIETAIAGIRKKERKGVKK